METEANIIHDDLYDDKNRSALLLEQKLNCQNNTHIEINKNINSLSSLDKDKNNKKKRCNICNKKLGMMIFKCECGIDELCSLHRLPQTHKCSFDWKKHDIAKLIKENPQIIAKKINMI